MAFVEWWQYVTGDVMTWLKSLILILFIFAGAESLLSSIFKFISEKFGKK